MAGSTVRDDTANVRVQLAILVLSVAAALAVPARAAAAGEIYWFSLLSENVHAAVDFYSNLFGWEIDSSPTGGFMALRDGRPFAGFSSIANRVPEASESLWLAAINVDDVGKSVSAARQLGATVHQGITELPEWGTYALIQDPQGAPLLLVHATRGLGGTQGYSGWRWAELWTHDPRAAADFYGKVVGYELEGVPVGDQTYDVFRSSGTRNAGLVQLDRPEIAARWAPYVGVTDLRGILVRVWENGGKVLREPAEIDNAVAGANRVALIADPTGAALFLFQLDAQAVADPVVAANASRGRQPERSVRVDDDPPHVAVFVGVEQGFVSGWDVNYPTYPYRPFGPRF